jgi:hypothetical protein
MASAKNKPWSLDPQDVTSSASKQTLGGRKRAAQSRVQDVTRYGLTLTHRPTGVEVAGEVPEGHYSKQRLRELKDQLHARLFAELEQRVARHLRIPGR